MKKFFLSFAIMAFTLMLPTRMQASMDLSDHHLMPDTVVLLDKTELHGLIVKNNAEEVVLQEHRGEQVIPKSHIRRINDQGGIQVFFADMINSHKLPPWQMIVQDLRTDDNIRSFEQIPPTTIENGYLKNVPYFSFRINQHVEMNVYGDPEDPVCLEFGIYERNKEKITRFKKLIREYLAGTLESRAEIAALYALKETSDENQAGNLRFRITPPTSPDAYGGWWFSIYDPKRLEKARVSEKEYVRVTLPFYQVNGHNGQLLEDRDMDHLKFLSDTMMTWSKMIPDLRGFYRDKMGNLKLLTSQSASNAVTQ